MAQAVPRRYAGTEFEAAYETLREKGVFRIRNGNPDSVDKEEMARIWNKHNCITIGLWGVLQNAIPESIRQEAQEERVRYTPENLSDEYLNGQDIDWDQLRDEIAEEVYDGNKSSAGQARGSLEKFVDQASEGSRVLGTTPYGTQVGIIEDDFAYYDPTHPATGPISDHALVRRVRWLRDGYGDPIIIKDEESVLPSPLHPARLTMTRVDEDDLEVITDGMAVLDFLGAD